VGLWSSPLVNLLIWRSGVIMHSSKRG